MAMPGGNRWFEEPGGEFLDDEFPDDEFLDDEFPEEDASDDDLSETVHCAQCGAEIYEDAVRCPVCGAYLTPDTSAWSRRPKWWIILGLLGILAVVLALICSWIG